MSNPTAKTLMGEYNKLQDSIAQNDPQGKKCSIVDRSVVQPTTTTSQATASSATSSSGISSPYLSIIAVIYPVTEPFQGRGLRVEIRVPSRYPSELPEVYMKSQFRHPNIAKNGRVCTDLLDKEKSASKAISLIDVIQIIIDLMDKPELGHIVDAEMGSSCQTDNAAYHQKIREMVKNAGEPRA